MPPTTRRPGDQAPPPRPTHRNPGATASTHQKSTAGKLYLVHDGDGNILELGGVRGEGLSYDEARRYKDFAVTKHKQRRASIREMTLHDQVEALPDKGYIDPNPTQAVIADVPNPDPELEAARQKALAAARPVAQQAQAKHEAVKKSATGKPVQRAPGWEPPPAGVTGARQAPKVDPKAPAQRAPGFEAPKGGAKSAPPAPELVEIDPIPEGGEDSLEIDEGDIANVSASEMVSGGERSKDLESEIERVARETEEKVKKACAEIKPGSVVCYFSDETEDYELAKVTAVHALSCVTLKLGVSDDMVEELEPGKPTVKADAEPAGDLKKSVMLAPLKGSRAGTWQPVL